MTALSDLIMRNPEFNSVSEALRQAELWSKKALDIATQHSSRLNNVVHCDAVLVAAAYNIGILKKVSCLSNPPRPLSKCFCLACADDG